MAGNLQHDDNRVTAIGGISSTSSTTVISPKVNSTTFGLFVDPSGGVAGAATDSGNPTKVGFVYNTSQPTYTNGQRTDGQADVNGNLNVNIKTLISGEDQTNNVMRTEEQYSFSAVAVADVQVKGSAGFLHSATFSCNDAAPTAGSIIIYNSLSETGTQIFNHTFTTTPFVPFTAIFDAVMSTGIYLGFTTTGDVNVSLSYR